MRRKDLVPGNKYILRNYGYVTVDTYQPLIGCVCITTTSGHKMVTRAWKLRDLTDYSLLNDIVI